MKKYGLRSLVSGSILITLLGILLLYPSLLVAPLVKDPYVPFGNLIFWAAFIAFPIFLDNVSRGFTIPYPGMKSRIQKAFKWAVLFALLWWPISYLLAGNFSNTFQNQEEFVGSTEASQWFWGYSYFVVLFPIALWLMRAALAVSGLFRKKQ